MTTRDTTLTRTSARILPLSTAERDIGSDLKRSSMPPFRSSAIPMAVPIVEKVTDCTMIPGIRYCT